MSEPEKPDLEERVAKLERHVEALLRGAPSEQQRPEPVAPSRPPGVKPLAGAWSHEPRRDSPSLGGQSERWLGRIGIAFVVLAMAFLLKLSFDRGWITPPLRLVAGLGVGTVLLVFGLRLEPARRRLAQALLGGSIAIFYLVGFAGFQLYELLPFWVAISLMTTTTVLSMVLSERQDSPLLAVIGVSGGLATPFLLETWWGNVTALAVYALVVLLGGGAVQLYRGWMSLLGTLLAGGTIVLSMIVWLPDGAVAVPGLAVWVFWLVCAASPLLRPAIKSLPPRDGPDEWALWATRAAVGWATAATVILLSVHLSLEGREVGLLLFFFGLMTGVAAYHTRGVSLSQWPSAEISALCVAFGLLFVAADSTGLLFIVTESLILFALVARGAPSSLGTIGHALAAIVVMGFLSYAANAPLDGLVGLREGAITRLGVLGMFVVGSMWVEEDAAPVYRGTAFVGLLVWFLSELGPRTYGAPLVSIAWSLQGATALIVSVRKRSQPLQVAGLATLGLVAAKLLLFDLSQLDPVWRILMFMSFGAGLLGLAYLVNRPLSAAQQKRRRGGA